MNEERDNTPNPEKARDESLPRLAERIEKKTRSMIANLQRDAEALSKELSERENTDRGHEPEP